MSSQSSSQYPSTSHSRNRIYTNESYKKSVQTYYTPSVPRMAPSSSPPLSSSPPMTPYSTRDARSDALIRSSPEIGSDALFHGVREHMNDPPSAWGTRYSSIGYPERAFTPLKRDYFSTHSYPLSSEFDVFEYSEDVDHEIPEADSERTSEGAPGRNSVFFSDTEEEENNWNDGFSFGHSGYRTTFFRTSAERGQWKSHPIPLKSTPLAQARSSICIPSRLPTPVLVDSTRTASEPAPSTVTGLGFSVELDKHDNPRDEDGPLSILLENIAESKLQREVVSPPPMPSLTSDWESMPDIDDDTHEYERPSSPLPPSSPMSYLASRSVSPASSSLMRSSSPLSEISSLDQDERQTDEAESINHPNIEVKIRYSVSVHTSNLDADMRSGDTLDDKMPSLQSDSAPSDFQVLEPYSDPSFSSTAATASASSPDHGTKHPFPSDNADIASEATNTVSPSPDPSVTESLKGRSHSLGITRPKRPKAMQEIEDSITQMKMEDDNYNKHAVRRKKRKGNDSEDEHPMPKKHKVDTKVAVLLRPMTNSSVQNEKMKVQVKKVEKPDQQISTKKRRRKVQVEVSIPCPASSRKRSKPHRPLPKASSSSSHLSHLDGKDRHTPVSLPRTQDPATVALNAEICGMLIETMALSRASSLPISSLYKMVMQTQPSLKLQRSEAEWLIVFASVLQEGEAGRGSGVFGKVESSGKDDSNRPLEAQWFYVPERDQDQERAALFRSMMPRPAKRTETKKYKQYYWRPLDKISKWDPEDEL